MTNGVTVPAGSGALLPKLGDGVFAEVPAS